MRGLSLHRLPLSLCKATSTILSVLQEKEEEILESLLAGTGSTWICKQWTFCCRHGRDGLCGDTSYPFYWSLFKANQSDKTHGHYNNEHRNKNTIIIIQYTQLWSFEMSVHAVCSVQCSVTGRGSEVSCQGSGGQRKGAFPSCFATLPFLFFALELPEAPRPNVPPLDH